MKKAKALVACGFVVASVGVFVQPAAASGATITAPEEVITPIGDSVTFDGSVDPYNGFLRQLVIEGGTGPNPDDACDHGEFPDDGDMGSDGGANGGCWSAQIQGSPGTLDVANLTGHQHAGNAEIDQDGPFPTAGPININGSREEVNAALADVIWLPPSDYESTTGGDPGTLTIFARDGDGDDAVWQDEDGNVIEDSGGTPVFPLSMSLRAENDPNEGPDLSIDVVTQPFPVAASTTPSTTDDEVLLSNTDGNGTDEFADEVFFEDPDLDDDEPDDFALFVVWLDPADPADANFSLLPSASPCFYDSVETFLLQDPSHPCTIFDGPVSATVIPPDVVSGLSFGTDTQGERALLFLARHQLNPNETEPTDDSTAEEILSRIEFFPPQVDCDCTMSVAVSDLGNNGVPLPNLVKGVLIPDPGFDFETIDFKVRDADNDGPVVTAAPAGPTPVAELASVSLGFTVTDPDAECDLTLTGLTAVGGTVTGGPAVPLDGSADALTTALSSLTFTAAELPGNPALGSVTAAVEDNGCGPVAVEADNLTASATATFTVEEDGQPDTDPDPVANDPPLIQGPTEALATEGVPLDVGDFTVTDPDVAAGLMDLTISVPAGEGSLSSTGAADQTLAQVNSILDALTFTPDDVDTDDEVDVPITILVDDNGNTGTGGPLSDDHTVLVDVDDDDVPPPANDAPVILGPPTESATEGVLLAFGDFTVTDPDVDDVGGTGLMDLTISIPAGEGTLSSAGGTNQTLVQVNTILDGLTMTPAQDADAIDDSVPVTITVDDNGNTGTGGPLADTHVVTVSVDDDDDVPDVNDPPVIAGPTDADAVEAVALDVGDFTVTDPDVGAGLMDFVVGVPGGSGTLSSTGATDQTLAQVNALLDALTFTPADDADTDPELDVAITITVDDNGNTGTGGVMSAVHVVNVDVVDDDDVDPEVNDPPLIQGPTAHSGTEGLAIAFDDFTVSDPDVGAGLMDLVIGVPAGSGTLSSIGATNQTLAQVNTILDALTFTPAQDIDLDNEVVQVLITVNDLGNTGTGGAKQDTHTVDLTITDDDEPPVANQPPTITAPGAQVVVEGGQIVFTGGLAVTIGDPDAGAGQLLLHIAATGNGDVALAAIADALGTVAQLQAILDDLVFNAGAPGAASITITVDDQGNTGTGGAQTASATIPITVTAAPSGPTTTPTTAATPTTPTTGGAATSTTVGSGVGAGGTGSGTALPSTGAELMRLTGFALVLVGLGGLLSGARRRPTTPR